MSARELDRRLRRLEASLPHPRHQPAEPGAEALEAMDTCIARMLALLPDPDSPAWSPEHHTVLAKAAVLHRRRWARPSGGGPQHDLMADPEAVVQVARIFRGVGVP